MFNGVKALVFGGLIVPVIAVVAACTPAQAPAPREVTLTASNFQYAPKAVALKAGEKVKLVVTNSSATKHNFHIDGQKLEVDIEPGQSKTLEWTVPSKAGNIDFGCEVHEKQGMKGEFKVE